MFFKKYFIFISTLTAVFSYGASAFAEDDIFSTGEVPSEIEMLQYLKEGAADHSGLRCGFYDREGYLIAKKIILPTKHRINLDGHSFIIHTSKKSPSESLSDQTREYLRKLLTSYDENRMFGFENIGIVSEGPRSLGFNWIMGSSPHGILRDMFLLKKELEKNAPDLLIISDEGPCLYEDE